MRLGGQGPGNEARRRVNTLPPAPGSVTFAPKGEGKEEEGKVEGGEGDGYNCMESIY